MSMSEPLEPELDKGTQTSVRDTEGEDEPDVFLPRPGAGEAPDEADEQVHLPEETPFRTPDPDELHRG